MDGIERLRELERNSVGGDLLPPAWAELVRALPALLDVAEAASAFRGSSDSWEQAIAKRDALLAALAALDKLP